MVSSRTSSKITLGSGAEDKFIEIFCEVFGPEKTANILIQYPFVDIYGKNRYIDFAFLSKNEKIAIEIDGEFIHNPLKTSNEKYYDDLLRQNSLIYENWKVYRWTDIQLNKFRDKVKDELVTFLGELPELNLINEFLPSQVGRAYTLREHQEEALENLKNMRKNGETIALLYHATGTGKTVTAVEDAKSVGGRTLFLAHTKELVEQARKTFEQSWGEVCGTYMGDIKEKDKHVVCASIQSIAPNIEEFNKDDFKYIIIDEAHHAAAETYRKILRYFKPEFTLGLTATEERSDGEDLLKLFQTVAHKLDIERAVKQGILCEIRCVRVKTNMDISDVRINGIKYNSQDLETKLFVPERNSVLLETYKNYVEGKRTVIFCISVSHAEEVAKLFNENGVKAAAISGSMSDSERKRVLREYEEGKIEVLCARDLLNEGWDSPKTEVLFMARPTMSKTIYMQQLGRGTRKAQGKEYLMVFDFIENANLFNMPYSAHRVFNIEEYIPGALLFGHGKNKKVEYDALRKGEKPIAIIDLPVDIKDIEPIDLFNWQNEVKGMISQIEFVRRVNVQSETISRYLREGKLKADLEIPMGTSTFKYFTEDSLRKYADEFGWKIINEANLKEVFIEFVRKMDMSYSYKPILLKAMLECSDRNGKAEIKDIVDYFIDFYEDRRSKGLEPEKKKSIYNEEIIDKKAAKKNIFGNPFKRFEDMNFMRKCKDIEFIEFHPSIWRKLSRDERVMMSRVCDEKLKNYYNE